MELEVSNLCAELDEIRTDYAKEFGIIFNPLTES